jgi:hypothetical protein
MSIVDDPNFQALVQESVLGEIVGSTAAVIAIFGQTPVTDRRSEVLNAAAEVVEASVAADLLGKDHPSIVAEAAWIRAGMPPREPVAPSRLRLEDVMREVAVIEGDIANGTTVYTSTRRMAEFLRAIEPHLAAIERAALSESDVEILDAVEGLRDEIDLETNP